MRKALYFLGILNDSDADWLAAAAEARSVPAGVVIIELGRPVDSVFLVIHGQLQVYSGAVEIARLMAGEMVGEMSYVDSLPPSASVRALVDSQVLAIPKAALSAKLNKDPGFASRFYHSVATFLAYRLRVADMRLSGPQNDMANAEDLDELPANTLENLALASARFDMIIKRMGGHSGYPAADNS